MCVCVCARAEAATDLIAVGSSPVQRSAPISVSFLETPVRVSGEADYSVQVFPGVCLWHCLHVLLLPRSRVSCLLPASGTGGLAAGIPARSLRVLAHALAAMQSERRGTDLPCQGRELVHQRPRLPRHKPSDAQARVSHVQGGPQGASKQGAADLSRAR